MGAFFDLMLGYLLTWEAVVIIAVLGIWAEHSESRGVAVFLALVGMAVAYFTFNVPIMYIVYGVIAYMLFGVLWSFYRYRRYVIKRVEDVKNEREAIRASVARDIHPSRMLGTITAWIVIWPFSLIDNFIGDVIDAIESLVKTVFKGVYHRIYTSAIGKLNLPQ